MARIRVVAMGSGRLPEAPVVVRGGVARDLQVVCAWLLAHEPCPYPTVPVLAGPHPSLYEVSMQAQAA